MAQFETWLEADLQKPVTVKQIAGNVFSADSQSNVIRVRVTDGGANATLSGTVTGYIVRDDGATVIVTGTLSGNIVSIVLPTSAYVVVGPISIAIRLTTGDVKTVLAACTGYVYRTSTDTIVDPGHVIPSIEELLAQIAACEAATTAANTAASNANTKAGLADTAASNANTKAGLADTAAGRANAAAAALEDMTASATGLAAGASPTATVTTVDGHYVVTFGIPKGDTGDKGDTGNNAAITNEATAYQNSTSGTVIPTGTWLDTQPDTPQGKYLWMRRTITWNNTQTTVFYAVSRMGIDGSGSVVSVCQVSPDSNGNVALTYSDVNAAPASHNHDDRYYTETEVDGLSDSLDDEYDATQIYQEGDTCMHDLVLHKRKSWGGSTPAAEAWTAANWEAVTVIDKMATDDSAIKTELETAENSIAYIVEGKQSAVSVASGKYVLVKGSTMTGVTDGLYTAAQAIPANTDLTSSYFTATSGGGLNSLSAQIANLEGITNLNNLITWDIASIGRSALKIGRVVIINFRTNNAVNINTTLFTLPNEYIPYALKNNLYQNDDTMYFPANSYDNSVTGVQIAVKNTGAVIVVGRGMPAYTGGNLVFIV